MLRAQLLTKSQEYKFVNQGEPSQVNNERYSM
jgi:hypothetical protein